MVDRFHKLLEVLPSQMSAIRTNSVCINQNLDTICIQQWDEELPIYHGHINIIEQDGKLVGTRFWRQGSYPLDEGELEHWINLIESFYKEPKVLEYDEARKECTTSSS